MAGFVTTADASGYVYVPEPSGDAETDWANIQSALDSMGPGDTVVLTAGHYMVPRPLVKVGFCGAIVGAGMDETIIEAVRNSDDYFEAGHNPVFDTGTTEDWYTAIFILGAPEKKLAMSDLTLEVNEADIAELSYTKVLGDPPTYYYWSNPGQQIFSAVEVTLAQNCDTSFDNVKVTGVPGLGWAGSFRNGISIWYSEGGKHTVTNSFFEYIGSFSYGPFMCSNAKVVVQGNQFVNGQRGSQTFGCTGMNVEFRDNSYTDMAWPGVVNQQLGNSHVLISGNSFEDCVGGVWTYLDGVPVGSTYIIKQNDIDMPSWVDFGGIEIWDGGLEKSHFVINHNTIHHEDMLAPYGPICLNGVHNSEIVNNEITGYGPAAVFIGTWFPLVDDVGLKIINNDVLGFEVTDGWWHDFETGQFVETDPFAHYYLGPYSSYCTLVLGSSADTYLDSGMSNHIVERG
jgi:hypothetical protein